MNNYERLESIMAYIKCDQCDGIGYRKSLSPYGLWPKCKTCDGQGGHISSKKLIEFLIKWFDQMCLRK